MSIFSTNISFYKKQMLLGVGTNLVAMLILVILLYRTFYNDYKEELIESIQSKASIVSSSVSSALVFDDNDSALGILREIHKHPDYRYVQIYSADHKLFAEEKRNADLVPLAFSSVKDGSEEVGDLVFYKKAIFFDSELIGHIVLCASTESFQGRKARLRWILISAAALTSVLVFFISLRPQREMGRPIRALIDLVRYVKENQVYDRRLQIDREDDIGDLASGVNQMLDTIEHQHKQTELHAEELESLVELRTKQLFERANYDILTRLPNRHLLVEHLEEAISKADRCGNSSAVLFLDLNRFKVINDSLGHAIGDKLLKIVAYKLCYALRKVDCVSRWGGDEFVVVVQDVTSRENVEVLCEKIIEVINEPCVIDDHQLHVSASIGVSIYPEHGTDSSALLKHADTSMYLAKQQGGGNYCFFNKTMLEESVERLSLEESVRKAIETNQFNVVYQPQVESHSCKLVCTEVLARWYDGKKFISPDKFIPVIEELGLMFTFTSMIVHEVCKTIRGVLDRGGEPFPVAINLSPSVLVLPNCVDMILEEIRTTGISANYLEIEITESSFLESTEQVNSNLLRLRNEGIEVALDDFGTGYSCLSYLKDLPISKMKIDGSFVRKIGEDDVSSGIILAIVMMAKTLNLKLIAECVETHEQFDFLKDHDVDYVQGYLFSKPLTLPELADFIEKTGGAIKV